MFMRREPLDQVQDGAALSPVERDTLAALRRLLHSEDYAEGDKLPPERSLAERFQVSRRVLKNAFAVLEAEGKVWRGVGQGTFVGRRAPGAVPDLTRLARTANPVAVIEARLSFEPTVARFAAQRASSHDVQTLWETFDHAARAKSIEEFTRWDERFHEGLIASAQNSVFNAIYDVISGVWTRLRWGAILEQAYTQEWRRVYSRQHRVILEAIESRDLDRAEILALEHWQTMRHNLIREPLREQPRGG